MSINNNFGMNGDANPEAALAFVQEHADEYVDGTLQSEIALVFERCTQLYPACADEVRTARLVKEGLQSISSLTCPDHIVDNVFDRISQERSITGRRAPNLLLSFLQPGWKPAFATAAVAVVVLMLTLQTPAEPDYTQAEIDQALREVKWTLAYLGDVGKRTSSTIRDEVLVSHVVTPINESVRIALE